VKIEKGVFDVLSAMRLVRENYDLTVNLDVCGVGDIAKLKQKAEEDGLVENVMIHGWVEAKTIKELMSNATAFILPSYYEGLPMSILEAMAASVPVIASNVGGIPDIIKDGENGMLIEPGDIKAMAEKIQRIVENREERIEISQKAKEMIMTNYSQQIVIDKLIEIYTRVLQEDMRLLFAKDE
jgi:glycosyltransferase involved in cell wall biosynthesis